MCWQVMLVAGYGCCMLHLALCGPQVARMLKKQLYRVYEQASHAIRCMDGQSHVSELHVPAISGETILEWGELLVSSTLS
jgi:hypothetical protein